MDQRSKNHRFLLDVRVRGRDEKWFRGGLVFKAHRWLYHSTLGSREIKEKKKVVGRLTVTPRAQKAPAEALELLAGHAPRRSLRHCCGGAFDLAACRDTSPIRKGPLASSQFKNSWFAET